MLQKIHPFYTGRIPAQFDPEGVLDTPRHRGFIVTGIRFFRRIYE
jgi:hypothetical protein